MTRWQRWLRYLSILAVLLNIAAASAHYYILHKMGTLGKLAPGAVIQPVIGVDALGNYVTEGVVNVYPCHVVRYTSVHCPSCRRDEPSWNHFDEVLRKRGCDSTILSPSARDMPAVPSLANERVLPIVPALVAQQTNLLATPTTIVLDRDWKVVWSALGVLQSGDTEKALSSLAK